MQMTNRLVHADFKFLSIDSIYRIWVSRNTHYIIINIKLLQCLDISYIYIYDNELVKLQGAPSGIKSQLDFRDVPKGPPQFTHSMQNNGFFKISPEKGNSYSKSNEADNYSASKNPPSPIDVLQRRKILYMFKNNRRPKDLNDHLIMIQPCS